MTNALIVVDVQPTFCEDGELAVTGGNDVAHAIAGFIETNREKFDLVVSTQDWHINPGTHFSDQPDFIDSWPVHAVAKTVNARLHPALHKVKFDYKIKKGQYEAAYSGFDGKTKNGFSLEAILKNHHVDRVYVVGIAESHCVAATAIDAKRLGFETFVIQELTVPVSKELGELARHSMLIFGVEYVSQDSI